MCRLRSVGIEAALKEVFADIEHRTQHWVQWISVANSSGAIDAKVARLEKEVEALKSAMQRSRSPRMRPRHGALHTVTRDGGTSGSGQSLFAVQGFTAWGPETTENRKLVVARVVQEGWRQRWSCSHELRADHGSGPTETVPAVPRVVQGDVLEVPEGSMQRRFGVPAQAQFYRLQHRRKAVQFLSLLAVEAQLIVSLRTS